MDVFSTPMITVILGVFGLAVAAIVRWLAKTEKGIRWDLSAAVAGIIIIFVSLSSMKKSFWSRLQRYYEPFSEVHENRHGVVTVADNGEVWGGGLYDGVFNTDLVVDRYWNIRPFTISAFHASPRRVLMIGLASGSWAKIVANNPVVEELTVVEINPGYLDLIRKRPLAADLLDDPKVSINIDDGRRWLNSHPDRQFDLIVMNTTYHWRASSSNLLSVEFLKMIRKHLVTTQVLNAAG
jgi:spermidine synthase